MTLPFNFMIFPIIGAADNRYDKNKLKSKSTVFRCRKIFPFKRVGPEVKMSSLRSENWMLRHLCYIYIYTQILRSVGLHGGQYIKK